MIQARARLRFLTTKPTAVKPIASKDHVLGSGAASDSPTRITLLKSGLMSAVFSVKLSELKLLGSSSSESSGMRLKSLSNVERLSTSPLLVLPLPDVAPSNDSKSDRSEGPL